MAKTRQTKKDTYSIKDGEEDGQGIGSLVNQTQAEVNNVDTTRVVTNNS